MDLYARKVLPGILLIIFLTLLVLPLSLASHQPTAEWHPVGGKQTFDRRAQHFCPEPQQCLLHPSGNPAFDNDPKKFFEASASVQQFPRCINDEQYILDFYCDKGNWTTRTKQIATQLAALSQEQSPGKDFTIYCDHYKQALNHVLDQTSFGIADNFLRATFTGLDTLGVSTRYPFINNVCIMSYERGTAFGVSLNKPITQSETTLKALDAPADACNNIDSQLKLFLRCDKSPYNNPLYYNPFLNAIIYFPPTFQTSFTDQFMQNPFKAVKNYVFEKVQPKSGSFPLDYNFTIYNETRLFNVLYYDVHGSTKVFAFAEQNQTNLRLDYFGLRFEGHPNTFPNEVCKDLLNSFYSEHGTKPPYFCENQTSTTEFIIVAKDDQSNHQLTPFFPDFTAKMRPS